MKPHSTTPPPLHPNRQFLTWLGQGWELASRGRCDWKGQNELHGIVGIFLGFCRHRPGWCFVGLVKGDKRWADWLKDGGSRTLDRKIWRWSYIILTSVCHKMPNVRCTVQSLWGRIIERQNLLLSSWKNEAAHEQQAAIGSRRIGIEGLTHRDTSYQIP